MSVIVDVSVPAEEFPLGSLLEVRPGVQVRLETMIPTGEQVVPYFWVRSPDVEAVESALEAADIVEGVRVVDQVGDETLFRVGWSQDIDGLFDSVRESDAVVLEGTGLGDSWLFQLRFPDDDRLSTFYRDVVDRDIPVEIEQIHDPVDSPQLGNFGLTEVQRETLVTALEAGYFAVPRETTLIELAERLEVSDTAISQRLRRALTSLLNDVLVRDGETP